MKEITDMLNTVIQGDCLEVMKQMPDKCIDLVLTDPPYGTTQNDWDSIPNLSVMWKELERIGKENCAFVMTTAQPFTTELINSNRENFKYDLIWYKPLATGFLNANLMPLRNHEVILIFSKKKVTYNPQKFVGKMRRAGKTSPNSTSNYGNFGAKESAEHDDYFPQSVVEFGNADKTNRHHPTEKPVELMKYLVATYSNENEIILDPFGGSCTTAVAAKQLNRKYICIEKEEKYVNICNQRLAQDLLF